MLALIEGLDVANVTIEVDSTKCIYLMVVDKPV